MTTCSCCMPASRGLSQSLGSGERTLGHLGAGDVFGVDEIASSRLAVDAPRAPCTLKAMGYADIVRIPAPVAEPYLSNAQSAANGAGNNRMRGEPGAPLAQSHIDFFVDSRLVNGTRAMVIDTTRCVDCDDCVRACAATHGGVPRFVRNGPKIGPLMIANSCMHCTDPVCLIDCPTGAIHREAQTGSVVIDEATCIGCATCAGSCPYGNIRMEAIRDEHGVRHIDPDGSEILLATKCDFCAGQAGGPACKRACPHDALSRVDLTDPLHPQAWVTPARAS